jgi:drug/metabolite transporter (DMT)-like permease
MGVAFISDVNGGSQEGVSLVQSTTYKGKRCSAARAFVDPIRADRRLTLKCNTVATRDARPLTLYMAAVASILLLILCVASGDFALPRTASGWIGFGAAAAFYGFAMIAFFIAISMIGPVRTSLLSYAEAVISAGLGVVVLGQALTLVQVAGIALVILALVGATRPR